MAAMSKAKLGGIGLPSWFTKSLEDVYKEKYGGRYPGLAENVASGVGTGLKAIGLPKHIAETTGRNITSLAEDWTPAGALTATEEYGPLGALAALPLVGSKGKKLAKGLGDAAEHLPNVEKTAAAVVDPVAPQGLGIRAYHGSPHSFEEFDISKIGTGEGAQAYGHGLYFAENEDVAKSYRDALADMPPSGDPVRTIAEKLKRNGSDIEAGLRRIFPDLSDEQVAATAQQARDFKPGHMYEVDIAADPEAFLDWDKPLSEQSEAVRKGLGSLVGNPESVVSARNKAFSDFDAGAISRDERNRLLGRLEAPLTPDMPGHSIYAKLAGTGESNTARLQRAGIPGIRYLDQGSRNAGGWHITPPDQTVSGKWMVKSSDYNSREGCTSTLRQRRKPHSMKRSQGKPTTTSSSIRN